MGCLMKIRKLNLKPLLTAFIIILLAAAPGLNLFSQFNPIKFELDSLPNGLQVIYCVDKSAPVVATVVHYRVGSRNEIPGKTGYAHFFEHLMFEATDAIPRSTIDKYVQEAGGELNAHTSWDETVFYLKVPANEIKLPLWIESQRMRHLHVDSIGVETQRGVVTEELKMRTLNQPYGTLIQKVCENLFKNSSYGWAVVGLEKDIHVATISDFKQFYDTYYQPENATLVICGDFDIPQAKEYVKAYFGGYPRSNSDKNSTFTLPPLDQPYRETIVDEKAQMPALFVTYRGPKLGDDDYYAASLLCDVLASGESSRLYQRLVDKDQIAVQAQMEPLSLQNSGALILIGIPANGKSIKKVEEVMLDEVNNVIENGITDEELTKVKNITEAKFVQGKKEVLDKAMTLARYNSYYNNPGMINTEIDKYLKVTKDDIKRVAKKYFSTDNKVTLIYVPKDYKE
jgi:predicted Zn-dependent peptidase